MQNQGNHLMTRGGPVHGIAPGLFVILTIPTRYEETFIIPIDGLRVCSKRTDTAQCISN